MRSIAQRRLLLGILAAANLGLASRAATDPEDELKAAIVLSFLRYTEWPHPPPPGGPITVGVFGSPEFTQVLRRVTEGKSVAGRGIRVVDVGSTTDPQCCSAIYFASDKSSEMRQPLNAALAARALTIGDSKDFLELGGAVNLLLVDGRMSFEVNLDALGQSGVTISSKLLRFGLIHGRPKGGAS